MFVPWDMTPSVEPLCPACTQPGRLIGRDEWGRDLFTCHTAGCDVVEYDEQMIRCRDGAVLDPPGHARRSGKGVPAYWAGSVP